MITRSRQGRAVLSRRLVRCCATGFFFVLMLSSAWVFPPMIHRARRLCPVRPDGIAESAAMPLFARKYNVACNTCHVPAFPKLNDFGNTFRDHGYQMGTDNDLPTSAKISMGYWPLSFRTTVGYQSAHAGSKGDSVNTGSFGFTGLDILSAGILTRNVSFLVVYTPGLNSSGFGTAGNGGGDLESAFVRFDDIQGYLGMAKDTYLVNLKFGKFAIDQPADEHRSPTIDSNFVMYHYTAGTPYAIPALVNANAGYVNPNGFALGNNELGAELSGMAQTGEGESRYYLAAFNNTTMAPSNTGAAPATIALGGTCPPGAIGCAPTGSGTGGRDLNFYGHITQSIGGYGTVIGQRIGVFGVYGKAPTGLSAACPNCAGAASQSAIYTRAGVDLSLTYNNEWNLFGAVMQSTDRRDLFASQGVVGGQNAVWNGGYVELDYYPAVLPVFGLPNCLFVYRYDGVLNKQQGDPTFDRHFNNVSSHTASWRYNFYISNRADITWHNEYNYTRIARVGPKGSDEIAQTVMTGIDFAF